MGSKLKLYRKVGIDDKFSKNMKGFWIDDFPFRGFRSTEET